MVAGLVRPSSLLAWKRTMDIVPLAERHTCAVGIWARPVVCCRMWGRALGLAWKMRVGPWGVEQDHHAGWRVCCSVHEQVSWSDHMGRREREAHAGLENGLLGHKDHLSARWHKDCNGLAVGQRNAAELVILPGRRCWCLRYGRCGLSGGPGSRSRVCSCVDRIVDSSTKT